MPIRLADEAALERLAVWALRHYAPMIPVSIDGLRRLGVETVGALMALPYISRCFSCQSKTRFDQCAHPPDLNAPSAFEH